MKWIVLCFIVMFPLLGLAQPVIFHQDSVPTVEGKVVFDVDLTSDLNKEEVHKRTLTYLNDELNPYSGTFLISNQDYVASRITDYFEIEAGIFQTFGMYMTYTLELRYSEGLCQIVFRDISYMESTYFEAQEESAKKLDMPVHSAQDIMINKNFSLMFIKDVSERTTEASIDRINGIVKEMSSLLK